MVSSAAYVLRSKEEDLYKHLALEEHLLNNLKENQIILYLWQSKNSVIIGKNQNPWIECSIPYVNENHVILGRRISGGGTVFQDLGNLNFSFFSDRKNYNQTHHFQIILSALKTLGISASLDLRHALIVKGKKFSGNAFFYRKDKILHHGTILVRANLAEMRKCLLSTLKGIHSKAIFSVRSDVINLAEIIPTLDCEKVAQAIIDQFVISFSKKPIVITNEVSPDVRGIELLYKKYRSWNWIFGRTPKFDLCLNVQIGKVEKALKIHVVNGLISEIRVTTGELKKLDERMLREILIGSPFKKGAIGLSIRHPRVNSKISKEVYTILSSIKDLA